MRDTGAGTLARRCEYFIRRTACAHDVHSGHTYCGYHNLFMEFTVFYRQGSTRWQVKNDAILLKRNSWHPHSFYFSFSYFERTLFALYYPRPFILKFSGYIFFYEDI